MINKIDIKGGQMTFGQRIELGKILENQSLSEAQKFTLCMEALDCTVKYDNEHMQYWEEIIRGIKFWVEKETRDLKYRPTPEEYAAGIEVLSMQVAEMGTIMAISEKFSQDPDAVLQWKYGKIFNILYTNLHSFLYSLRLQKIQAKKYNKKGGKL